MSEDCVKQQVGLMALTNMLHSPLRDVLVLRSESLLHRVVRTACDSHVCELEVPCVNE